MDFSASSRLVGRRTRVKVCCIKDAQEAALAIELGVDALGLVSAMPSGPGCITEEAIAAIIPLVPPGISTFLLTCKPTVEEIIAQQRVCQCSTIQLVDHYSTESLQKLRASLPGVKLVQVIHVTSVESLQEAQFAAPDVDAILLDSGNTKIRLCFEDLKMHTLLTASFVKELGGTGRTHNWEVSTMIVQAVSKSVFLAGGLSPQNIAAAISMVRPFGVDVCSGVRTDGQLDRAKLAAFMENVALIDLKMSNSFGRQ